MSAVLSQRWRSTVLYASEGLDEARSALTVFGADAVEYARRHLIGLRGISPAERDVARGADACREKSEDYIQVGQEEALTRTVRNDRKSQPGNPGAVARSLTVFVDSGSIFVAASLPATSMSCSGRSSRVRKETDFPFVPRLRCRQGSGCDRRSRPVALRRRVRTAYTRQADAGKNIMDTTTLLIVVVVLLLVGGGGFFTDVASEREPI